MDETQLLKQNSTQASYFFLAYYSNGFGAPLPPLVVLLVPPPTPPQPSVSNAVGATNNDLVFQTELLKHGTEKTENSTLIF